MKAESAEANGETKRSEGREDAEEQAKPPYMISGDNGWRDPPVPIPNTEVKPPRADGTWLETARETMSLPDSNNGLKIRSSVFFLLHVDLKRCVLSQ